MMRALIAFVWCLIASCSGLWALFNLLMLFGGGLDKLPSRSVRELGSEFLQAAVFGAISLWSVVMLALAVGT